MCYYALSRPRSPATFPRALHHPRMNSPRSNNVVPPRFKSPYKHCSLSIFQDIPTINIHKPQWNISVFNHVSSTWLSNHGEISGNTWKYCLNKAYKTNPANLDFLESFGRLAPSSCCGLRRLMTCARPSPPTRSARDRPSSSCSRTNFPEPSGDSLAPTTRDVT